MVIKLKMAVVNVVLVCFLGLVVSANCVKIKEDFFRNIAVNPKQITTTYDYEQDCDKISAELDSSVQIVGEANPYFCLDSFSYMKYLPNLEHLILTSLSMRVMKPGIFNEAKYLKTLQIQNNELESISVNFFNNLLVEAIDLSHNKLDYIAIGAFDNMTKLKLIDLSYNNIKRLRKNWVYKCSMLQFVNLSHNQVGKVQKKAFKHIRPSNEVYVNLSNNEIVLLEEKTFVNFEDRGTIDLSGNQLSNLPVNMFGFTRIGGFYLNLTANKFTCLEKQILNRVIMNCKSVELLENPLTCECAKKIENFNRKRGNELIKFDYCL